MLPVYVQFPRDVAQYFLHVLHVIWLAWVRLSVRLHVEGQIDALQGG
jgi:hypothetical protein